MPEPYTLTIRRYDEIRVPGHPLGRIVVIDSRSAAYPYARRITTISSIEHPRHTPILDQGDVGSCTGNAEVGALATTPLFEALPARHPALDEAEALRIYSAAEKLDGGVGYPPEDDGSTGNSVCKAARNAGLISGWNHALTVDDVLSALMDGPVLLGIDWYDSFDTPAADGLVTIGKGAVVRGGHEIVCRRVDADRKRIGPDNSWGASWGVEGSFWLSYTTLEQLLAQQGDCQVPLPLSAPVPVPVPTPTPTPGPTPTPTPTPGPDAALAAYLADARLIGWAGHRHVGDNAYAARAYTALRKVMGA